MTIEDLGEGGQWIPFNFIFETPPGSQQRVDILTRIYDLEVESDYQIDLVPYEDGNWYLFVPDGYADQTGIDSLVDELTKKVNHTKACLYLVSLIKKELIKLKSKDLE